MPLRQDEFQFVDRTAMHIWLDTGRRDDGYGLIVLDPPWENASAARGAKYTTLPSRNLLGLPLQRLAHSVRVLS